MFELAAHESENNSCTNRPLRRLVPRLALRFLTLSLVILGAGRGWAVDVPFSAGHTIDGAFDFAVSVHAADMDGDGDVDVLGAALLDDDIAWWENLNGAGTSWTAHTIDGSFEGAVSVYAADMDGDGDLDALGAAYVADDITWWENLTGAGTSWTTHTIDGFFDGAVSVDAADVDGDGDLDVLGTAEFDDDIAWWENLNGAGTSWTAHTIDGSFDGAFSVDAADMDGDGDLDVLGAAADADDITWWENLNGAGTSWTAHTLDGFFDGAVSVDAADVDGDGDLDVLGAAQLANDITWWENLNGAGTSWTAHMIDGSFDGAFSVDAADMDGDGDLDVLGTGVAEDIRWWENLNGAGISWTAHTIDGSFDGARSVDAADVDGDGDLDVLGAASFADDIVWFENKTIHRNAIFPAEHTIDGAFDGAYSVDVGDVDGDGDLDVLGAALGADDITWWENLTGAGTSWTEHTIGGDFDGAVSVHTGDVDGDGDLDVLGAAARADDITWWENRGGQFALPTLSLAPAQTPLAGQQRAVLEINPRHNGRGGDTDVEIVTAELLFDDGTTPLTEVQANDVIDRVAVYLDDGSGTFDPADEPPIATVSSLALTGGVQVISFADGNPDVQIQLGSARKYFAVLDFLAGTQINMLRVTHLTESTSTGEDRDHDIPLKLEYFSNVSTPTILLLGGGGGGGGSGCTVDLLLADQTITGTHTLQGTSTATLGPNLIVNGTNIAVNAPTVSILEGADISGIFSIGVNPACP